jgi:hypothetical protein
MAVSFPTMRLMANQRTSRFVMARMRALVERTRLRVIFSEATNARPALTH